MANVTLALTGVAGTGAVGSLRYLSGSVALALLPQIAIRGSTGAAATAAVTLPTPVISIRGLTSVVGKVRLTLPSPTLAAAGFSGASGAVALTLPAPEVAILGPAAARLRLPVPQVAVKGTTGAVGFVSLLMRAPTLQLAASIPHVGAVALTLPAPAVRSQALTGLVGASHNTLREFALAIRGYSGTVGKVELTLPVVQLDAAGAMLVTGKVELTLPALQLQATGESAATGPVSTVVMQTETNSVWTYSNFPFNSFAQFNGVYLGASANGLFALTGDTDNGEMIQAAARVGITDFATSHLKRVDRLYVGYRTDGNLVLRVFTDEVTERDYLLPTNQAAGLHGARVRVGKGLEARYWQFEIDNQNGAYFDLNMIELQPTVLKRRVGGFDA
jgi:hypothetical protein